jgi:hypothetical protein
MAMQKKQPKKLAIVHQPKEQPLYHERQLSAELEFGGEIHVIIRRKSIHACIAGILAAARLIKNDSERTIEVTLTFWCLDEDLDALTITVNASDYDVVDRAEKIEQIVWRLCAKAQRKFVAALAKQEITLIGEEGALAA